jgi:hypothetical protein
LLLDLKRRGLAMASELAVADGALGFLTPGRVGGVIGRRPHLPRQIEHVGRTTAYSKNQPH